MTSKIILALMVYAVVSSYGLYRLKLSEMVFGVDLIVGFFFYGAGFFIWLVMLKLNPLASVFPVAAGLLIIVTQLVGFFLLKEDITTVKIIGAIIIIIGIILIAYE